MIEKLGLIAIFSTSSGGAQVSSLAELRQAASTAQPGATVVIAPGEYRGGLFLSNLRGRPGQPITIRGADPKNPPRFVGGAGVHISGAAHVRLENLAIERTSGNGLNIDDGGKAGEPARDVVVRNVRVADLPRGNHDGIKLSGVAKFRIENCTIERWGGSGIDMVGCHEGTIEGCTLRQGGDSGVQAKGGSSKIEIVNCRFDEPGQRGVNLGGSTGMAYFRPPVASMPPGGRYEAKDLTVRGCTFVGGVAAIAFVGVEGARVERNTIYHPGKWAVRILQETREPGFVPCRNGVFERNLIVFLSSQWGEGGVNIGPGTAPESFAFRENYWYCSDQPNRSRPRLPSTESGGVFGIDPQLLNAKAGDLRLKSGSPAQGYGAPEPR